MKTLLLSCLSLSFLVAGTHIMAADKTPPALDFKMNTLDGKPVELSKYSGKVILVVNVASFCGYTRQYAPLEKIYQKYKDQGFVVIGVPCNQFGKQEPGSATDIAEFCESNYGVTFPMLEKVDVNGDNAAPFYQFLTSAETNPGHSGKIGWNFEKFLIGRSGAIVNRFSSGVAPDSAKLISAVEAELGKE